MATQMNPKEATEYLRNLRRLPGWEEGEAIMIPTREVAAALDAVLPPLEAMNSEQAAA